MTNGLTASKIAKELNSEAKTVNEALLKIGFLRKDVTGYFAIHALGETIKGRDGKTFVKWDEAILTNKVFLDALEANNNVTDETYSVAEVKEDVTYLTATQVGKTVELSSKDVNHILSNLDYMEKLDKGYRVLNKTLGEQKLYKDRPFVVWTEALLNDILFLEEVNKKISNKKSFEEEAKENIASSKEDASPAVKFKFDRKNFDAEFRTISGHFVRSRGEVIVADWLFTNACNGNSDLLFSYEKRVPIMEELYSDFYLPKHKIYIEVWGLESTKYLERKEKKIALYKEHGFKLIGLDDDDIKNLDDFLPLKLLELGVKFS